MDRKELRQRIGQHPNSVSFDELAALLDAYGWILDRKGGSHMVFARERETLVVPYRRPHVLAVYVKHVLRATEGEDDED